MTYWLIAFLFTPEGQMVSRTPIEMASKAQCVKEAGKFAAETVNSQYLVSLYCLPDDVYRKEILKDGNDF